MVGIDVSFAQGYPNWPGLADDVTIVIAKAASAEGGSLYTDSKLSYNRDGVRKLGRTFGTYFFNGPVDPVASANYYISVIDWKPGEIVALDVESPNTWGPSEAAAFATRVHELIGVWPWIYGSTSLLNDPVWQPLVDLGCEKWPANYGANTGSPGTPPSPTPWPHWIQWQYTSVATHAGLSGSVDTNQINDAALAAYLGSGATPTPPTPTKKKRDTEMTIIYRAKGSAQYIEDGFTYAMGSEGILRALDSSQYGDYIAAYPDTIVVEKAGGDLSRHVSAYGLYEYTGTAVTGPLAATGRIIGRSADVNNPNGSFYTAFPGVRDGVWPAPVAA